MFTDNEIEFQVSREYTFSQNLLKKIRQSAASYVADDIDIIDSEEARAALQKALAKLPEYELQKIQLQRADTDGVHDVTFGSQPLGDFYFSDLLSSIYEIKPESSILDFGCSTGRVIRNLRSVFDFDAYGCDPRKESISFNKETFKDVNWFVSNESPPLLSDSTHAFDMVFAISVWSHFSETLAMKWFDEMHSRLKDNGKLIFTTHGARSIYHFHNVLEKMPKNKAEERLEAIRAGKFHFMPYPSDNNDLNNKHWGMAFMGKTWIESNLSDKWKISSYKPGIAMKNQDLYVLSAV